MNKSQRRYIRDMDSSTSYHIKYRLRATKKNAKLKGLYCDLTYDQLIALHTKQAGQCALTGTRFYPQYSFSIDRIDSALGYTLDNIQLVLLRINLAKHTLSNQEFIKMCDQVVKFSRTGVLKDPAPSAGRNPHQSIASTPTKAASASSTILEGL